MSNIKQTNFRINQEDADAFRAYCESNNLSQAQGFDHMLQVMELSRAKTATPGRATEIEQFERAIKHINEAYLTSIEYSNDAEARVREQIILEMNRKEKTIDELREKIEKMEIDKKIADDSSAQAAKSVATAQERAEYAIAQMNAANRSAENQERINTLLTAQLSELTEKLNGYDALVTELEELKNKNKELDQNILTLKNTLHNQKQEHELAIERALVSKEQEMRHLMDEAAKKANDKYNTVKESEFNLKVQISTISSELKAAEHKLKAFQAQAALAQERAVNAKEKDLTNIIRQGELKIAKLTMQIEDYSSKYPSQKENS